MCGLVGGVVVLEWVEQVADGEQRCRRRTARRAASHVSSARQVWSRLVDLCCVMGRCRLRTYWIWIQCIRIVRIHCIHVNSDFAPVNRGGYTVPMPTRERRSCDADARETERRSSRRPARSSPPKTSTPCRCAGLRRRPASRCRRLCATSARRTHCSRRWSPKVMTTSSATSCVRRMDPGDVAAAVRVVAGDYEEAGQQLMHMLGQEHRFPALSQLLDIGRRGHRRWVRWAFSPQLADRDRCRRVQLEDLLVVATDVYTWKLLRIDRKLSARATRAAMTRAVRGGGRAMSRYLLATWDGGGTIPPGAGPGRGARRARPRGRGAQ